MTARNDIELAVHRWSAWAPGLSQAAHWRDWATGKRPIAGTDTPDVRFVEPMQRRRLSLFSRMAFRVAADCMEGETPPPFCVFASRYGDMVRSTEILKDLAAAQAPAPAAFSLSVHNTTSSLFAIARQDTSPWPALAGETATLETAFIEAWCQLRDGIVPSVLLICHDEVLPNPFETQQTSIRHSCAIALLLRLPDKAPDRRVLGLAWKAGADEPRGAARDTGLAVLRLLLGGDETAMTDAGRLIWTWSARGTPA